MQAEQSATLTLVIDLPIRSFSKKTATEALIGASSY